MRDTIVMPRRKTRQIMVGDVPVVGVTVSDIPVSDVSAEPETAVSADVPTVNIVEPAEAPVSE
ncbi:MAG: hypothetical protein JKY80_05550 [Mariprofundaceae bacterium]|nr:hypothetical protein [Mariprofundaceae bacterium]